MQVTLANLIRGAGVAALLGGTLFVGIQAVHPPETLAGASTATWALVHSFGIGMCLLNLVGIAGIYLRQAEKVGWIGLAGFLLLELMWAFSLPFQLIEAFILPSLVISNPSYAEAFLGIASGTAGDAGLGTLQALYSVTGVCYLLGGLLAGFATLRAGILPRWAAGMLAVGTVLPLAMSVLPHEYIRLAAVPVGVSLAWLGYALLTEQRVQTSTRQPAHVNPALRATAAK